MRQIQVIKKLAMGVALAGIWSPQVWAQTDQAAADEEIDGEEIIVTARRVDESLQDVPLTVNVVTDQKLKDLNLFNGSDLAAVVPGLTFSAQPGSSTPTLALRGAARGAAGGRLDPTVQTYLNEAPVSDVMLYQALYDIGQIEVLRGPQGTLRGRPSAAGAITFTTKRPDLTKSTGYVSLAASTLAQLRGEAAIGVPLIRDVLAVRVAGIIDRNDNDGVRSLFNGQKPYQDLTSWRASLRFKPTDNLDINVMYQNFRSTRGTFVQVSGLGYQGPSTPLNPVAQRLGANFNGPAISAFDRLSVSDALGIRDEHHKNLIGNIALDLGSFRVSYVGEYNKTRNTNFGGANITHVFPIPFPDPQLKTLEGFSKLITHELRFERTGSEFWDFGAGFYHEKNTSDNLVESVLRYLPGTYGNPFAPSLTAFNYNYKLILTGNFPVGWKNQAIYANSTFHVTPDTDLFVGARHVWYEQNSDQLGNLSSGIANGGNLLRCDGLVNTTSAATIAATADAPGAVRSPFIANTCDIPVAAQTIFASSPLASKEKAWVYNASLTHRFTDDITAYVSYGHSWRPATNNLNLQSSDPRVMTFANTKSETSNNYEAGLKMQLLDRKLSVNIAAFYQNYSGFLFSSLGVPYINNLTAGSTSVSTAAAIAVNADGKVKGFDIELAYRPSRQFSISANVNYARGRLSNQSVPCNDGDGNGVEDGIIATVASFGTEAVRYCRSSSALAFQSDWNASMQAEYNMPVSSAAEGYIRTLISYTPTNKFAPGGFTADNYGLVNLFLGVRSSDGKWDIGGYARNLTNTQKLVTRSIAELATPAEAQAAGALGLARSSGYRLAGLTPRREFGLTFRFNW